MNDFDIYYGSPSGGYPTVLENSFDWGLILSLIFFALAIFLFIFFLRKILRKLAGRKSYFDHAIYLVRMPKEKPHQEEKELTVERIHEEIAKGEAIFSAIGGLRAQKGLRAWFFGRNDHFSFEIVSRDGLINFYVCAPRNAAAYLEQQVLAQYPDAVMEEVGDYNIFSARGEIWAGSLATKRSFVFPLRTYKKMEVDPLNSIVNTVSKLRPEENLAIQYLVRSARPSWHGKVRDIIGNIKKGKSIKDALKVGTFHKIIELLGVIARAAAPGKKKEEKPFETREKLSAMEEEIVKHIEEKNSKAGLDLNLRIVVSARDKGSARSRLEDMVSAFNQFNYYEYGNIFSNKASTRRQTKLIRDFIFRRFDEKTGFLINSEEAASLFHLPEEWTETPNILWLTAKNAPAPANVPTEGLILGHNIFRGMKKEIKIKRDDRRRHTYIIGKSGVGKSALIASMAIQDILNGEGVGIIDPHGDLIADILPRIPAERAEDVILFSPADIERPLALNLLEYDERYPEQKTFVINEMIKIFDKLYDLKQTGGPIFEQYMRNAMLLAMNNPESGSTLMEIPKILADANFRRMKLDLCADPTVVDFWRQEAEKAGGEAALANVVPYVTSKLTSFISNDMMRPIIGQQNSSFNLREVMDKSKIILINLPKGQVGEMNAYLLGMILVGKILVAALSRTDLSKEKRKDFYLYIDEFQNFTTDSICSILSEARKYNLNLIMAHQYLGQLVKNQDTSVRDAVFGNAGTWLCFKVGSEDAKTIVKEFEPVFNEYDLINIEKYTAYVKLMIDNAASRPFSMKTLWPLPGIPNEKMADRIRALSRLKYGRDRRVIEAEIMKRSRASAEFGTKSQEDVD